MKQQSLFILLLIISINCLAQAPVIQWQKSLGGSGVDDAYSIRQTTDNGFITVGSSQSNDGNVSSNHGSFDYWVVKLNDTGAIQWQKSLGGSGDDKAEDVQQTIDGGYIVSGSSSSNNGDVSGNHGTSDYWIVKLNDTGGIQWQKCLGGRYGEYGAFSIRQTTDNGYIVTGQSQSNDGDISGNHGGNDYWVVKLNDTGAIQWQKSLGGSNEDDAYDIRQTADGGYIVAGQSASNDGDVTSNHGSSDYWVVKLNDTGAIQWQRSFGGSSDDDAYAIRQTTDGGYIVAGQSASNDGDVSGNHGGYDYWVVKLNDTGAIQWQKSLGGSSNDRVRDMQLTADGGYVITGWGGSNDGDASGNHGSSDYWIVKINDTGAIIWQQSFGGSNGDYASRIQQTYDGGYIVAGASASNDGDVSGNHGSSDYWIVKLSCGLSAGTISGDTVVCFGSSITLTDTASGGIWSISNGHATIASGIVTGVTAGADTVIFTKTNTCGTAITSFPFTVIHCPEEVKPISIAGSVSMIPNPTTGAIFIAGASKVTIKVYNTLGQLLKEATNTDNLSIAELPAGLYFVKIFNTEGALIKQDKIIKE